MPICFPASEPTALCFKAVLLAEFVINLVCLQAKVFLNTIRGCSSIITATVLMFYPIPFLSSQGGCTGPT